MLLHSSFSIIISEYINRPKNKVQHTKPVSYDDWEMFSRYFRTFQIFNETRGTCMPRLGGRRNSCLKQKCPWVLGSAPFTLCICSVLRQVMHWFPDSIYYKSRWYCLRFAAVFPKIRSHRSSRYVHRTTSDDFGADTVLSHRNLFCAHTI